MSFIGYCNRAQRVFLISIMPIIVGGCGTGFGSSNTSPPRPTLDLATLGVGSESTHFEESNNDLIQQAEPVSLGSESRVIRGTITRNGDVDVYDLGAVGRGTRIIVDITAEPDSAVALALFDETGALMLVNDHLNAYMGRREPFVDVVMRADSDSCYLAVSATPGFIGLGDYALLARKEEPVPIPSARPDIVLLDFEGTRSARIGQRNPIDIPAFDAGSIDGTYAGSTQQMIAKIVAEVREDYFDLNVTILSTSEGDRFDGSQTRLFFGTFDPALLGIADGVDEFNSQSAQNAIVFADTFAAFMGLAPTLSEMAQSIANVASHEIGHLLGMVHTADPGGIMDVTASLGQLLVDQSFRMSPLYSDVFPVGYQNALQLMLYGVGGVIDPAAVKSWDLLDQQQKAAPFSAEPPARNGIILSTCDLCRG